MPPDGPDIFLSGERCDAFGTSFDIVVLLGHILSSFVSLSLLSCPFPTSFADRAWTIANVDLRDCSDTGVGKG